MLTHPAGLTPIDVAVRWHVAIALLCLVVVWGAEHPDPPPPPPHVHHGGRRAPPWFGGAP